MSESRNHVKHCETLWNHIRTTACCSMLLHLAKQLCVSATEHRNSWRSRSNSSRMALAKPCCWARLSSSLDRWNMLKLRESADEESDRLGPNKTHGKTCHLEFRVIWCHLLYNEVIYSCHYLCIGRPVSDKSHSVLHTVALLQAWGGAGPHPPHGDLHISSHRKISRWISPCRDYKEMILKLLNGSKWLNMGHDSADTWNWQVHKLKRQGVPKTSTFINLSSNPSNINQNSTSINLISNPGTIWYYPSVLQSEYRTNSSSDPTAIQAASVQSAMARRKALTSRAAEARRSWSSACST